MFRLILFSSFLSLFYSLKAQESFEFKSALPPENDIVKTVDPIVFGSYKNEQTGTEIILNNEGISMITIITSYITKEQVRESSKYEVRNEYLFGVVDGDSVPCIFEDDKYFFGIKQKITLNDENHRAIIKKISSQIYVLNFIESKGYSPTMLEFRNGALVMKHFTYPNNPSTFSKISKSEQSKDNEITLHLLNPSQKEWNALDKTIIFDKDIVFLKQ